MLKNVIFVAIAALLMTGCGNQKDSFIVSTTSDKNLTETTKNIENAVQKEKFTLVNTADNKIIADEYNISIRPQRVVRFTQPQVASILISCNPTMGMEVPFKILVWGDYSGVTHIEYINPEYWSLTHNIKDKKCLDLVGQTKIAIEKAVADVTEK
ncbi:MAG: DUF302 domain-containing protein [Sulfurovaceae bacterium]|nr:DUF302 domain-containing protein [Sulfurovaceae bacterium]